MDFVPTAALLSKIMRNAYADGFADCRRYFAPDSDEVRESKVKDWLRGLGYDYKVFKVMVQRNLISPHYKSAAPHAVRYYSRSEILKVYHENENFNSLLECYVKPKQKKTYNPFNV